MKNAFFDQSFDLSNHSSINNSSSISQEIGYMGLVSAFNELHPEIASAGLHVSWTRIDSLNCASCAPREKLEGLRLQ